MAKRPHNTEDSDAAPAAVVDENSDPPSKKARKETNASAQRTLFVRSLPAIATSEALTELFSQNYPLKHATVVLDTDTKQSKGYGFVTLADAEDAQKALEEFNGQVFLGRRMKIEIAQPRSRELTKSQGLDGKRKSQISVEAAAIKKAREEKMAEDRKPPKLIIRNLPWSVKTPEQLAELFKKFGKVKHSTLPKIKDDTQAGFGFVVLRGRKNAEKALASMNGTLVDGRIVAVDWAVDKNVWESQNKSSEDQDEATDDEDNGANLDKPAEPENEDDDVANFFKNFGDNLESEDDEDGEKLDSDQEMDDWEDESNSNSDAEGEEMEDDKPKKVLITDNSTTLFVRNLPFTTLDADLKEHFNQFGPVRYARVVMDRATDRPKGTGFVCFFNVEDADACYRGAPRHQLTGANAIAPKVKHSILENENADSTGSYTIDGRVIQIAKAVDRDSASKLTENGTNFRTERDKDKRKLYLLSEGTVASGTPLYEMLAPSEVKMREDSAMQRKKLIQTNPTLHLSLTRLSIRNLPRNINSTDLKALAREAVVAFAKDVKDGKRAQLSKEEEVRGGEDMKQAEKQRKAKGKGIVRQAKIVFEGREGAKIPEESGAGRSRGYGFVEYSSHRWALMGLRWLNGHALENASGKKQRLIVEFAIENAQVVQRRKEKEEKARLRSKEVVEMRERGEAPPKEKKELSKSIVMKKTRVGMKGKKGRPLKAEKSFDKVEIKSPVTKRKRDGDEDQGPRKKSAKGEGAKPEESSGKDEKLRMKAQIIQKKRMARKNRKG
ncbi:RNA-binding domain-containing protein [Mollisia scopiformis]|uniref:RNA-binding domain-containing protein n=1 Tax=Mollisia scopiformis TaxID=149040 RepID=A0A194XHM8_MOLSC|nr:RNA-binding domain-containing protein [Mollisia scopiformis]KUJ19663.1 RNA-binding domain-containing protein [Mollisia scopiformis]